MEPLTQKLTEKQKKRLLALAEVLDDGDIALLKHLTDLEDRIDEATGNLIGPKGEKGDKGEPGNDGIDGRDGVDGKDGRDGVDGKDSEVPGPKGEMGPPGPAGKDGSPDTPEQIVEKLESLEGDARLDKKAVKGLEEEFQEVYRKMPTGKGGGARGIQLYTNGTKRGMAQMVNIIPGIGVSLTYDYAHGRNDVTINASASTSVLTATGTINDSNTAFTFTREPSIIVINGASYRSTGGPITWTWSSGTLTATLSSPVGSGGDIYGIA